MRPFWWPLGLCFACAASSLGCNDILGIWEPYPYADVGGSGGMPATSTTTSQGGIGGTSENGGAGGAGGSGSTTTSAPCAGMITATFEAVQDGPLFMGACNGAISPGSSDFANIGLGIGMFRFVISDPVHTAFENDQVLSMDLTLSRAPTCGDPNPCTVKADGAFEARPARNDWEEGNGSSYSGADYCRRAAGNPGPQWASPGAMGAADAGEQSGTTSVVNADETLVIALDPQTHAPWIGDVGHQLSVRLSRTDGVAVFVAVQRESTNPAARPKLNVTYCP